MSNIFENNEPPEIIHEAVGPGNRLFTMLPVLPAGEKYTLKKISDGRTAVVILRG